MGYIAIDNAEIEVDDAITQSLMQKVKDNFDYLYTASSGSEGFLNPSFDTDADSDGDPDNWTVTDYAGGSHSLDATNAAHGAYALKFVHPGGAGNGGGYAVSDYIPCNESYQFKIAFLHKCSASGVKIIMVVRYFSSAKVWVSDENIYSKTTNPTSWCPEISDQSTPPAGAKYMKIQVVGGYTDTDPGSSTDIWFDGLRIVNDVFVKDRADTNVYLDTSVVFQDLDTNKDVMLVLSGVGANNAATYMQLSDDNGATYTSFSNGAAIVTDVGISTTINEWIITGNLKLKRMAGGSTQIEKDTLSSNTGSFTVPTSATRTVHLCETAVNCVRVYAASAFDVAAASIAVYERSQ